MLLSNTSEIAFATVCALKVGYMGPRAEYLAIGNWCGACVRVCVCVCARVCVCVRVCVGARVGGGWWCGRVCVRVVGAESGAITHLWQICIFYGADNETEERAEDRRVVILWPALRLSSRQDDHIH